MKLEEINTGFPRYVSFVKKDGKIVFKGTLEEYRKVIQGSSYNQHA